MWSLHELWHIPKISESSHVSIEHDMLDVITIGVARRVSISSLDVLHETIQITPFFVIMPTSNNLNLSLSYSIYQCHDSQHQASHSLTV